MPSFGPKYTLRGWPYSSDFSEALRRVSYTQVPVGRVKLPYDSSHTLRTAQEGANYLRAYINEAHDITSFGNPAEYNRYLISANNSALAKLKEQIAEFTQQGENLGQASKSMKMVTDRLGQVTKSYMALRKGRFGDFCDILRINPKRKDAHLVNSRRRVQKQASGLFLEYTYGWKPLVSDIYVGLNAIVDAPQNVKRPIRARASSGTFPVYMRPNRVSGGSGRYDVDLRAIITVTDENLFTLNRTGLINPVTIAWQLLPFSFIVDWFVNVEQFVNSLTDYIGLRVDDPSTSVRSRAVSNEYELGVTPPQYCTFESYGLRRTLSLPVVVLAPKLALGLSIQHGKVAASLLVQIMSGRGGNRVV